MHDVSATYLAKHLQSLSRAGLVTSTPGQVGGYALSRKPDEISLLEIVEAVDGTEPAFVCTEIRQRGPVALSPENCIKSCGIKRTMLAADEAWRASLASVTIADLTVGMEAQYGPQVLIGMQGWLRTTSQASPAGQ